MTWKPPRPIDAVIFDCDGTLVDSVPLGVEVLAEYLETLGIVLSPEEVGARFGAGSFADAITAFESATGVRLPDAFVPELRRRREEAFQQRLRPIEGARELLESLRLPVAVASNGPLRQTRLSLEVTGLARFFSTNVVSAYDIGSFKPDPALFLHAATKLGVSPSRCAVVEDADIGVRAALAAGMSVFAFRVDGIEKSSEVCVIDRLQDIAAYLGRPS